jgi:hypothetical protein
MGILALGADERVSQVKVSERALTVTLKDGRTINCAVDLVSQVAQRLSPAKKELANCGWRLWHSLARNRRRSKH